MYDPATIFDDNDNLREPLLLRDAIVGVDTQDHSNNDDENAAVYVDDGDNDDLDTTKALIEGPVHFICGIPTQGDWTMEVVCDTWHRSLAGIFMTTLLLIQFRVATVDAGDWNCGLIFQILAFGVAGALFRGALPVDTSPPLLVQLWPEVTTDLLLLIILLGYTNAAIFLLNTLTLSQSLHAAWNCWEFLQLPPSEQSLQPIVGTSLDLTFHVRRDRRYKKVDDESAASVVSLEDEKQAVPYSAVSDCWCSQTV